MNEASNSRHALYTRMITRHHHDLFGYILSMHPNFNEANDIMQETALGLWQRFDEYDEERPFVNWAFRFAYFEVLRYRKSRSRSRLIFTDELIDMLHEDSLRKKPEMERRHQALEQCMQKLDEEDRVLIEQRYGSSSTIRQLAESWRLPVKRLYKRMERLRLKLFQCVNHTVGQFS
ncbi:MAG: sigma-70 family RNA polymerase sigma factor [Pontiellaceae bacterium]|nr:sigma-70 family RNA polymerase sigma factor [Pontiellaceae bacterium]MBN2783698.1 sigma-70 family RNA polymerase sigma factor [Pontiellaceae bacterium]